MREPSRHDRSPGCVDLIGALWNIAVGAYDSSGV